ncbi:MAG: glycoside hydrolase family 97 catalytic domain-containing protein [Bacteroidota bacterium]
MTKLMYGIVAGLTFLTTLFQCSPDDGSWKLESPDQQIRVNIHQQELNSSNRLFYSVYRKENRSFIQLTDPSPLGIEREDSRFVENLEFVSAEIKSNQKDQYSLVSGKNLNHQNRFNTITLTFKNLDKQKVSFIFRAYDGGIAFRYLFTGRSESDVRVIREHTGFDFKEGNFWGHPYDTLTKWNPAYETYYQGPVAIGSTAPRNKNGWAFPLLIESEDTWMLVSEAGFDGTYGASHLHAKCENGKYMIKFAEQGEAEGYYENTSHSSLPWYTPWRFIAIGKTLNKIVETSLATDLAAPSTLQNTTWIIPGRSSWSWWSDSESPQDYNRLVPFVDFAAAMGWEYSLVDANWNRMKNGSIEKLAQYAKSKNVGLLLWYNSGGKHNVVTEEPRDLLNNRKTRRKEFERISRMEVKGIKVDFFQSDKQDIIKQYIEILEDAAEFNLLVNFHGCTLPKGWRRTWPNLVTMEAVKGGENYIFTSDFPKMAPSHLTILPYTRNAIGPVDYTIGGFSDNRYPHLTTFGFEMALPVLLESGMMHYMDTPEKTKELPPFVTEFLKEIPVVWEETRYIAGYPGKDAVIARKNGNRWYIAGINGENLAKELTIDLTSIDFEGSDIHLIEDNNSARNLQRTAMQYNGGEISIHMEPYGGFTGYWE